MNNCVQFSSQSLMGSFKLTDLNFLYSSLILSLPIEFLLLNSPADSGLDLDLWYIENILTGYDSQHLQTSESI